VLKRFSLYFLCSLVGAVFIASALTKLFPIEPFEFTFVDTGVSNWQAAPFFARLLIALELAIGLLLLLNVNLRRLSYKLAIGILLFFSLYLITQMFFAGNKGNCGCFGEYLPMTPFQALIKNIALIILLLLLNRHHSGWELRGRRALLLAMPVVVSLSLPFVLNPVELDYSASYLNKPEENFKLELDTLYAKATLHAPPQGLDKGKHVISFMTLSCPHCRIAAKKMRIMYQQDPSLPIFFVLNGKKEKLPEFYEDTGSEKVPHCMLKGRSFTYLAGNSWPAIYLVNNGIVELQMDYQTLTEKDLKEWLGK
jgi:hypothetical protein